MRKIVFLVCFLWTWNCFAEIAKPPINIFGEWLCYRYFSGEVEGGGSSDAKRAIGEKIDFEKDSVKFTRKNQQNFLAFPSGIVERVTYEWEKVNLYGDTSNSYLQLSYRGPLKEESDSYAYVVTTKSVPGHFVHSFELSRNGELTYYYSGQVFFFKKVSLGESEKMGGLFEWLKRLFR